MARTASGKAKADGTKEKGSPKKRAISKAAPDTGSTKSASMVKMSPNAKTFKAKGSGGQAPMDSAMAPKVLLAKMTLSRALNAKIGSFNAMHHSMDQKPRKLEATCPMALDVAATLLAPFEGPYSNTTSSGKTGYMLFKEETTAAAKASNKHAKGRSFSECGELWRNLSIDEKEAYKQRAGSAEGSSRSNSIGIGDTAAAAPGSSTSKKKPAGAAGGSKANGSGGDIADGLVPFYPKPVAENLSAEQRAQLADSLVVKTAAVAGRASASSSSPASVPPATLELYGRDPERALRVSRKCLARYAFQLGLSPSLGFPPPSPLAAAAVAKAFPTNKNSSSSNTSNTSNDSSSSSSSSSSSRVNSRCSSRNISGSSSSSSSNPSATLVANALSHAVREAEELRHLCLALPARLKEPPQWRTGSQGGAALEHLLGKHLFAAERICQGALTSYGSVKVAVVVKGSVEFTHDCTEGALKVTFATEFQRRN